MKKIFAILILATLSFTAYAAKDVPQLLKCLALEEEQFHKQKIVDPYYRLNQKMVMLLAQFPALHTSVELTDKVCKTPFKYHPALVFFEEILLSPNEIFNTDESLDPMQNALLKNTVTELKAQFPDLLMGFLADLESTLEVPNCLYKEIPEAKKLVERFKYLQSEVSYEALFEDKASLKKIFKKLNSWPIIVKRCQETVPTRE